jgi:hypothetical protein
VHRNNDITTANELSIDENLGDSRPRGELLDTVSEVIRLKNVIGSKLGTYNRVTVESIPTSACYYRARRRCGPSRFNTSTVVLENPQAGALGDP